MRSVKAFFCGSLLALSLMALLCHEAPADEVVMENGKVWSGEIVFESDAEIKMKVEFGVIPIDKSKVVEIRRKKTPNQLHEEAYLDCKTAEDFYQLGLKAKNEWNLPKAAYINDFQRAVELDPEHEGARKGLGYHLMNGEWVDDETYYTAKGYKQWEGEWYPEAEFQRLRKAYRDKLRSAAEEAQAKFMEEQKARPWPQAHRIETDHYIIKCNSTREVAQRYADFMEALYDKYNKLFAKFPKQHTGKSTIFILANHKNFMEMLMKSPYTGGYYMPGSYSGLPARLVAAYHGAFGDTGNTYTVLAHEGTHQFEHLVFKGEQEGVMAVREFMVRPMWIIEGLAVYFGDGHYVDSKGDIQIGIPRDRLEVLQRSIRAKTVLPLRQLIRIPKPYFHGGHYAPSWGLIHYLVDKGSTVIGGKTINTKKVYEDFFQFVCEKPPAEAHSNPNFYAQKFEEMLGMSIDDLQKDWEKYILSLKLPVMGKIVKRNYYESDELEFQIKRPNARWEFDDENLRFSGEMVALSHARGSGRVGIVATNRYSDLPNEHLYREFRSKLGARFTNISDLQSTEYLHKQDNLGFDGQLFTFTATEKKSETDDFDPRPGRQQFRWYLIRTAWRDYGIIMQSDESESDGYQKDFDKILSLFRVTAE